MPTKNIQDVVAERVEECLPKSGDLQKVGDHYWGNDYEPSYYELINLEASFREILKPRLLQSLTQLVKEVEAGERKRIYDSFADCPSFDDALNEREALTPPTSDEEKQVHGVIIGNE